LGVSHAHFVAMADNGWRIKEVAEGNLGGAMRSRMSAVI